MTISINPLDRSFVRDPYPAFAQLREEAPVYWHEQTGYWWITRYQDVWNALRDPRFSAARTEVLLRGIPGSDTETTQYLRSMLEQRLLFTDGSRHTRLRSLLNQAFTPRQMDRMRPIVRATIRKQLDRLRGRNQFDVISELADPLPSQMICRIIGLPANHFDEFKGWTNDIYAFFGLARGDLGNRARAAAMAGRAASQFLQQLTAVRRQTPAEDLLTALIQAEEASEKLTTQEIILNIIGLVNAGHETTTHLLGNGLYLWLRHPDVLRAVRDDQTSCRRQRAFTARIGKSRSAGVSRTRHSETAAAEQSRGDLRLWTSFLHWRRPGPYDRRRVFRQCPRGMENNRTGRSHRVAPLSGLPWPVVPHSASFAI